MKSLSMDIRMRIVSLRKKGLGAACVAERLIVSERAVRSIWRKYRLTGSLEPARRGGRRKAKLAGREAALRGWRARKPGLTLRQMRARGRTGPQGR